MKLSSNNLIITIGIQGNINEKVLNLAFIAYQSSPLMNIIYLFLKIFLSIFDKTVYSYAHQPGV